MAVFPQIICIAIKLEIIVGMIPRHGADVEKIAGIFAQKVSNGDATHIVINEKMLHARRCIVRQMLQQIAVLVLDKQYFRYHLSQYEIKPPRNASPPPKVSCKVSVPLGCNVSHSNVLFWNLTPYK